MRRQILAALLPVACLVGVSACDDQVKYVGWFETMTQQPSVGTYQEPARPPVEGTMPADGWIEYSITEADTLLENPLTAAAENLVRGDSLFQSFCMPCHGEAGQGDGPVVGPGRLPPTPIMNLTSDRARDLTDGYMWGIIGQGRGLMPSYDRIPPEDRWYIILHVRDLQGEVELVQ
jgi:mono/diheme cytochrome c family protein